MPQRTVVITDEQNKFIDENAINFNKFVRIAIDKAMEEKKNASKK